MVTPNLIFWSILREESLESQHKLYLKKVSREYYCAQKNFQTPVAIGKIFLERELSFLTKVVFTYEQLFFPHNALFVKHVNVAR